MWSWYNPCIIYFHFFCILSVVIFCAPILSKYIDSGYLVSTTPILQYLKFDGYFCHCLQIINVGYACAFGLILSFFLLPFPHFEITVVSVLHSNTPVI